MHDVPLLHAGWPPSAPAAIDLPVTPRYAALASTPPRSLATFAETASRPHECVPSANPGPPSSSSPPNSFVDSVRQVSHQRAAPSTAQSRWPASYSQRRVSPRECDASLHARIPRLVCSPISLLARLRELVPTSLFPAWQILPAHLVQLDVICGDSRDSVNAKRRFGAEVNKRNAAIAVIQKKTRRR